MKKLVLGSLLLLSAGLRPLLAEERTLPPEIYAQMKKGIKLDQVWINPKYDTATGFNLGKVSTLADGIYANTVDYLKFTLEHLVVPGSPNILNVTVTQMDWVDHGAAGYFAASATVEGEVLDPGGNLMLAFSTHAKVANRQTVLDNYKGVYDKVEWSLYKDMGKGFQHAMDVKNQVTSGANPSGLVPRQPLPEEKPLDVQGRLLQLDDLKKKGLINEEEYKVHKAEILKGL